MIPLLHRCQTEGEQRYVTRLRYDPASVAAGDAGLLHVTDNSLLFAGKNGVLEVVGTGHDCFDGDVVLVDPKRNSLERLIRANSEHNTFLVTEQCDQLCVMCSQPPKKYHNDRFAEFEQAALMAPKSCFLGVSGGEPTLYKNELLSMIELVAAARPDISWHILSNGQHFEEDDVARLQKRAFRSVTWGIPLYSLVAENHDSIVGKTGAHHRLMQSLAVLLNAGASIELRTVLLNQNVDELPAMANFIVRYLGFINQWSIMQLENIGFAKNRFPQLYFQHGERFAPISDAIDIMTLFGCEVALFNFARCSVPQPYRRYTISSISDWKRKFANDCETCAERQECAGFFEWHPDDEMKVKPL